MTTETTNQELSFSGLASELAGKYLSFLLATEEYGVGILKVREIIALQDITSLPRMPDYIRGVINLRGRIIPVIDLRVKLGMDVPPDTAHTCIVVLDVENAKESSSAQIGCIVDTVSEVLDITSSQVEPPPKLGSNIDTGFIMGLGKIQDRNKVVALLDIDRVLSTADIVELAKIPTETSP